MLVYFSTRKMSFGKMWQNFLKAATLYLSTMFLFLFFFSVMINRSKVAKIHKRWIKIFF